MSLRTGTVAFTLLSFITTLLYSELRTQSSQSISPIVASQLESFSASRHSPFVSATLTLWCLSACSQNLQTPPPRHSDSIFLHLQLLFFNESTTSDAPDMSMILYDTLHPHRSFPSPLYHLHPLLLSVPFSCFSASSVGFGMLPFRSGCILIYFHLHVYAFIIVSAICCRVHPSVPLPLFDSLLSSVFLFRSFNSTSSLQSLYLSGSLPVSYWVSFRVSRENPR